MAWKELGILIGVLVVWFSLMRFVLPAMGFPTCMSGACGVGGCPVPGRSIPADGQSPAEVEPSGEVEDVSGEAPADPAPKESD